MSLLDERTHIAEEEGEQQGSDMAAIDVGIRHQNNLAVAQLCRIKILTETRAKRGNHRRQLIIAIDLVQPRFLYVEHLAPQRQNGLIPAVTAFLGRTACGIALDNVNLCQLRISLLTVCQLARQRTGFQCALAACHFTRLARCLSCAGCGLCLVNNRLADRRIFFKENGQLFAEHGIHQIAHIRIAQLGLGLAFKLRLRQLDGNHGGQTLTDIFAGEILIAVLQEAKLAGIVVNYLGQRRLKAGLMRTALCCIDVVCKRQQIFAVSIGILQRNLRHGIVAAALHIDHFRMQRRLVAVQIRDKLLDAALIVHHVLARLVIRIAFVAQRNFYAAVEERLLLQPIGENLIVIL